MPSTLLTTAGPPLKPPVESNTIAYCRKVQITYGLLALLYSRQQWLSLDDPWLTRLLCCSRGRLQTLPMSTEPSEPATSQTSRQRMFKLEDQGPRNPQLLVACTNMLTDTQSISYETSKSYSLLTGRRHRHWHRYGQALET